MGKLHKIKRAILRDPLAWRTTDRDRKGQRRYVAFAADLRKANRKYPNKRWRSSRNEWVPSRYHHTGAYRGFVAAVLRSQKLIE